MVDTNKRLMQASGFASLLSEAMNHYLGDDLRARIQIAINDNEAYLSDVLQEIREGNKPVIVQGDFGLTVHGVGRAFTVPAPEVAEDKIFSDAENLWENFWKPLLTVDGEVNLDLIKKELADYVRMLSWVPRVYCHVTGDMISKVNTWPSVVTQLHDERVERLVREGIEDAKEEGDGDSDDQGT